MKRFVCVCFGVLLLACLHWCPRDLSLTPGKTMVWRPSSRCNFLLNNFFAFQAAKGSKGYVESVTSYLHDTIAQVKPLYSDEVGLCCFVCRFFCHSQTITFFVSFPYHRGYLFFSPSLALWCRLHFFDCKKNASHLCFAIFFSSFPLSANLTVPLCAIPCVTNISSRLFSEQVWRFITPELFVSFWTLSQYDLEVPSAVYAATIQALKVQQVGCHSLHIMLFLNCMRARKLI